MKIREKVRPKKFWADLTFLVILKILAFASIIALCLVILVLVAESVPFFSEVSAIDFLFSNTWMPVDYGATTSFGIGNFIVATLFVSCLGLAFAFVVSLFASLFLCSLERSAIRDILCAGVDLLAGVPSVIYGFIGLVVLVKLFLEAGHPSGSCVLVASIVLAIMLLPFMVSSFCEAMGKIKNKYSRDSLNLGVGKWYFLTSIVLPKAFPYLLPAILRAFARGIGETMAVMMVVGNANLFPELLGKSETIASLIALEMGSAEVNSLHESALFASGLVLLLIVFIVNLLVEMISKALKTKKEFNSHSQTKFFGSQTRLLFSRGFATTTKLMSFLGIAIVLGLLVFLFAYCFYQGSSLISLEFLSTSPKGAMLGEQGGIFPAITGSLMFALVAVVFSFPLSCAFAMYLVFFCKSRRISGYLTHIFGVCSGIPSIVLGLFVYAVLVRSLGFGRCVFSGGIALGFMILPFLEVRFENSFRQISKDLVFSSLNLGCSLPYTIKRIVLPASAGDILATIALGASFAMGACAPLIFTGGVAFAPASTDIFSPAMALPLHLYLMIAQQTTIPQAYASAFVIMAIVLLINGLVAVVSERRKRKWKV